MVIVKIPNRGSGKWNRFQFERQKGRPESRSLNPSNGNRASNSQYGSCGVIMDHADQKIRCERCRKWFLSLDALQRHLQTSVQHRFDDPQHVSRSFVDQVYLEDFRVVCYYRFYSSNVVLIIWEPKKQANPEQSSCRGCNKWKQSPTLSQMQKHIENNECHNDWTIQHLNALAEECNGSAQFIIPQRRECVHEGAPPFKSKKRTGYDPYDYYLVCPNCDELFERESQLKEHLRTRECSHTGPSVLRCSSCPDYRFERLSDLFEHLERRRCRTARKDQCVTGLAQSLKRRFEDPAVQRGLDNDYLRLRADERRPGRRCADYPGLDDNELRRWRDTFII